MKRKIQLRILKAREKEILKDNIQKVDLDHKYCLATWDYEKDQLTMPLKEVSKTAPLWDWFTLYNKKTKKIWFVDFSFPFINETHMTNSYEKNIEYAVFDIYYDLIESDDFIKKSWISINSIFDDKDKDKKIEEIKKVNNWQLCFQEYEKETEKNKNWNEGLQVIRNHEDKLERDLSAIVPHQFYETDRSFADYFVEIVEKLENGKVLPFHKRKRYINLIENIKYKYFPYDKSISPEIFI